MILVVFQVFTVSVEVFSVVFLMFQQELDIRIFLL